jgi:hypothetical protein
MMCCRGRLVGVVRLRGVRRKGLEVAVVDSPDECHTAQDGKPDPDALWSFSPAVRDHGLAHSYFFYTLPGYVCQLAVSKAIFQ